VERIVLTDIYMRFEPREDDGDYLTGLGELSEAGLDTILAHLVSGGGDFKKDGNIAFTTEEILSKVNLLPRDTKNRIIIGLASYTVNVIVQYCAHVASIGGLQRIQTDNEIGFEETIKQLKMLL